MTSRFLHLLCKITGGACIFVLCMEMITKSNCQHQLLPHDLLLSAIGFDSTFAGFILGRCTIFFFVASVLMCLCIPCRGMGNNLCICTHMRTDIDTCTHMCTHMCMYKDMCTHMRTDIHTCAHTCAHTCTKTCVNVCMFVFQF